MNCTPQQAFDNIISNVMPPEEARKVLTSLYINYTMLIVSNGAGLELPDVDIELRLLRDMIRAVDGTYEI